MDTIDKAAWALVRTIATHYGADIAPEEFDMTLSRKLARAALAAMREPTPEMLSAGYAEMDKDDGRVALHLIWPAMVDAARSSS